MIFLRARIRPRIDAIPPVNAKVAAQIGGIPTCRTWRIVRSWATPDPAERAPPRMVVDLSNRLSVISMGVLTPVFFASKSWVDRAVLFAVGEYFAVWC